MHFQQARGGSLLGRRGADVRGRRDEDSIWPMVLALLVSFVALLPVCPEIEGG